MTAGAGIAFSIGSIFGGCGGSSRNRDSIDYGLEKIELNDYQWMEIQNDIEDKFFIVAWQLDIKSSEKQIINTEEKQAKALNGAIKIVQSNSRKLGACTQYFFSRDQELKIEINVASTLLALYSEAKSYRISTYAYRLTILDSVMTMIDKIVLMTLGPKGVLKKILESVATHQTKANDRLTLAIRPSQILTYFETKPLTNVVMAME